MIQERFVVWGTNEHHEKVLVGVDFNKRNYEVNVYLIPSKLLEKETIDQLFNAWAAGDQVALPENAVIIPRPLSEDSLLPDNIKVKDTFTIRRLQNEWAFYMLTSKLWENFQDELEVIKGKVSGLSSYDSAIFNECKEFWNRLLIQKKEKNISQERLDEFKTELNLIFEMLKSFRKEETKLFDEASARKKDEFMAQIRAIEDGMQKSKNNYKQLFDSLKDIQAQVKKTKLRKTHRNLIFTELNKNFETLISKRKQFSSGKLMRRIEGLDEVIKKMKYSIRQDKNELEFHNRKSSHIRATSIEVQLRQAKIKVLEDRIVSKEKKLEDIMDTYQKLQDKLGQL